MSLEQIKEIWVKFIEGNIKVPWQMANYEKTRVKITFRITKKNFQNEELRHESYLKLSFKTKIRNSFDNHMLTDIKLSKANLSKIIQWGGFPGALLG